MPTYNLSQLQAAQTGADLYTYANDSTGSALSGMFMVAIFFILLLLLKRWGFANSILASSFACFWLSLFLALGGYLNWLLVFFFATVMAFMGMYIFIRSRG